MVFNQIRRLFITLDATDKATKKLEQVDRTASDTSAEMKRASERAELFRRRLVAVGFGATILTGAIATMVQQVSQVSRTFGRIQGTAAATEEQMRKIRREAERIGAELPVRVNDAAKAFEQLSFAGLTVEEQLASANDVVNLAIAGNIQMAKAAKSAASSLNAFQLEAAEIGQITNSMGATFSNSALNVREMTKALSFAQSVAQMADQTFTEMTAAIGVLADAGLRASRAGTALERMFIELSKQSSSTKEGLRQLGLTLGDFKTNEGQFKNLLGIVRELNESTSNLEGVDRIQALQETFGARGARAAALLIENTDKFIRKIGDNARAQIAATIRTLDDLTQQQREAASAVLGFTVTGSESAEEMLQKFASLNVTTAELASRIDTAFSGISTQAAQILARDLDTLQRLREEASALSDAELQTRVQAEFNLNQEEAKQFAQQISSGESFRALAESINSMTTAADIAEEQMNSLWGQIEFLRGSIDSLILKLVSGMKPSLDLFFAATKAVLNTLNSMPNVVRGVGLGLTILNGILIALAANYAILSARAAFASSAIMETAVASGIARTAHVANGVAALVAGGHYSAAATAIWMNTGAKAINTARTVKNTLSHWANVASITASKIATDLYSATLTTLSTVLSIATLKTLALKAASLAAAGAMTVAAGAAKAFWTSLSLGLSQIIKILVISLASLLAALVGISELNLFGWGQQASAALNMVLSPLDPIIGAVEWLIALFVQLGGLGIDAVFWALSGVLAWTKRRIDDFIEAMLVLPIVNDFARDAMILTNQVLSLMSSLMKDAGDATGFLSKKWDELGLLIGDGIRLMLPLLARAGSAWDDFTTTVNDAIGRLHSVLIRLLFLLVPLQVWFNVEFPRMVESFKQGAVDMARTFAGTVMAIIAWATSIGSIVGMTRSAISDTVSVIERTFERGVTATVRMWRNLRNTVVNTVQGMVSFVVGGVRRMVRLVIGAGLMVVNWYEQTFPRTTSAIVAFATNVVKAGEQTVRIVEDMIEVLMTLGAIGVDSLQFLIKVIAAFGLIALGILREVGEMLFDFFAPIWEDVTEFISKKVDQAVGFIVSVWSGFVSWFRGVTQSIVNFIVPIWQDTLRAARVFWSTFVAEVTEDVEKIVSIWNQFTAEVQRRWNNVVSFLRAGARAFIASWVSFVREIRREWNQFVDRFMVRWNQIAGMVEDGVDVIVAAIGPAINVFRVFADGAVNAIVGLISFVVTTGRIILLFFEIVVGGLADVLNGVERVTDRMADMSVMEIVQMFLNAGRNAVQAVAEGIGNAPQILTSAGRGVVQALGQGISTAHQILMDAVTALLASIIPFMPSSDAQRGPLSNLTSWGRGFVSAIGSGITSASGTILGSIQSLFGMVLGPVRTLGEQVAHGIADGIKATTGVIGGAIGGAINSARTAINSVRSTAGNLMRGTQLGQGLTNIPSQIPNIVTGGSPLNGALSGITNTVTGQRQVQNRNNITVRFDGEVHDAQKVDRMVRDAIDEGKQEAVGFVEDTLDMGSDAVDDVLGGDS